MFVVAYGVIDVDTVFSFFTMNLHMFQEKSQLQISWNDF